MRRPAAPARVWLAVAVVALLAGCSVASQPAAVSGTASTSVAPRTSATTASPRPSSSASQVVAPAVRGLRPPVMAGVTWYPEGLPVGGTAAAYVAHVDGGSIGLLWMDSLRLRFRYVPGYTIPEGSPASPADSKPSTWVPTMVAAFNGGFMIKDHVGGYSYLGHVVSPLVPGKASITIDTSGHLKVGVWGQDIGSTSSTVVVRQNLRPLVRDGVSQASSSDSASAWGLANGGLLHANRSALGQLADGSLVYAYGSEVQAWQLAAALVQAHVRVAGMLDMNKSWPNGFTYTHAGGSTVGRRVLASMYRDPSMYLQRFKKDFFVALPR
jgi:hypothetical protein